MSAIRTFIALSTQPGVQQTVAAVQAMLKETEADVKWDPADKFHITLKFLGNVEVSKIDSLSTALSHSLSPFSSFEIIYNTVGVFPDLRDPRVIWIGTEAAAAVIELSSAVEHVCLGLGFPKENRAFHPHITLGRVKGIHHRDRLTDAIKTITFEPIPSRCSDVLLLKSDLKPSGSIYTILKSFPLQS